MNAVNNKVFFGFSYIFRNSIFFRSYNWIFEFAIIVSLVGQNNKKIQFLYCVMCAQNLKSYYLPTMWFRWK